MGHENKIRQAENMKTAEINLVSYSTENILFFSPVSHSFGKPIVEKRIKKNLDRPSDYL